MNYWWYIIFLLGACVLFFCSEKYRRHKAHREFEESNGTFDEHAQAALDNLERLQNPSPRDHFLAARIIDLNGHDGRINNVRVLNNVVGKYMHNLRPYVQQQIPTNDPLDWFEIDQIENFMERHRDIMQANPQHNDFIEAVLQARPKKIVTTLEKAKTEANNKKEAFQVFVEDNVVYTSDSQNVHDSAVNEQLRKTWRSLEQTTPPNLDRNKIYGEIISYINMYAGADREKSRRALRALDEVKGGKYNATIGATEDDILAKVWARSELPINFRNKKLIRDAVIDSLIDISADGEGVVCSNGRCARIMESLVHTDADSANIHGAMTVEQIRNDAFTQSNDILQRTVKEMAKDTRDPALQKVAQSYEDPEIQTDDVNETRFKDLVKNKIETFLDTTYKSKLTEKDYGNVRDHCLAAIESI